MLAWHRWLMHRTSVSICGLIFTDVSTVAIALPRLEPLQLVYSSESRAG